MGLFVTNQAVEVLPDVAAGVAPQLRSVIETGKPILQGTVEAETPAEPGVKRHFEHTYQPITTGIAVVQQQIGGLAVMGAAELPVGNVLIGLDEPVLPIQPDGLCLAVGGITGADVCCVGEQFFIRCGTGREVVGLGVNLRLDELFPEPFVERFLDGDLIVDARNNLGMIGKGQQDGDGQMIASADDECCVGVGQFREGGVGVGRLGMIDDDESQVFAGDGADDVAVPFGGRIVYCGRRDAPVRARFRRFV